MQPGDTSRWIEMARGVRAGDRPSEEEFSRAFYPHIMALTSVRIQDRESAYEITQDILLAVLTALREGRVHEPEKLPAFVVGTARNLIHDYWRKRAQLGDPLNLGLDEALIPDKGSDDGQENVEEGERRRLIFAAFQRLKPLDRKILFMTLFEGLNPRDIAAELDRKPEYIRNRKSRALVAVRRAVKKLMRNSRDRDL
jgi:RNA polymerase sigma-70 factor (ECF subfamily)